MTNQRATIHQIIQTLGLQPLPGEGGLYAETHRSSEVITAGTLPKRYSGQEKPFSTAILYLLTADSDSFSALHRLPTDEIYHFALGDPLEMNLLFPDGSYQTVILGQDLLHGQVVQFVVPAGVWQGSRVAPGGEYSLVGTIMAPGFTPSDYEGARREELFGQYPQAREAIARLTREENA